MPNPSVIAALNTNTEITTMLCQALQEEGYQSVAGSVSAFREGRQDLTTFLRLHDPAVVIWDIALPYDENWTYFQQVQASSAAQGRRFVLTTTNKAALEHITGPLPSLELIGKPYQLEDVLAAVRRAGGGGPATTDHATHC
jgi:DNA-binding response OmpR family regulator